MTEVDRGAALTYATESGARAYAQEIRRRWARRLLCGLLGGLLALAGAYYLLRDLAIIELDTGGTACWAWIDGDKQDLEARSSFVTSRWREIQKANKVQAHATAGYIADPGFDLGDNVFVDIKPKDPSMQCYLVTFQQRYRRLIIITRWRPSPEQGEAHNK